MPFDPENNKLSESPIVQIAISSSRQVVTFCCNIKLRAGNLTMLDSINDTLPGSRGYDTTEVWERKLAARLFAIPGVIGVWFKPYEISVQVYRAFKPEDVQVSAKRIIENFLVCNKPKQGKLQFPEICLN